jgi:hypothetical protein
MMHVTRTPSGNSPQDKLNLGAARQAHYFYNDLFIEGIQKGCYRLKPHEECDREFHQKYGQASKVDFVGINYYRRMNIFASLTVSASAPYLGGQPYADLDLEIPGKATFPGTSVPHNVLNDMGWELDPDGLYRLLIHVRDTSGLPILITENGLPQKHEKEQNPDLLDLRAPYIVAHLQALHHATREGAKLLGYVHWSIADNWELAMEYSNIARFGLYWVDRSDCQTVYRDVPAVHGTCPAQNGMPAMEAIDGKCSVIEVRGACTLPHHFTHGGKALAEAIHAHGVTEHLLQTYGTMVPDGSDVERPHCAQHPAECEHSHVQRQVDAIQRLVDWTRQQTDRLRLAAERARLRNDAAMKKIQDAHAAAQQHLQQMQRLADQAAQAADHAKAARDRRKSGLDNLRKIIDVIHGMHPGI